MTQPFVMSMKLVGDSASAVSATREARREIEALQRSAAGALQGRSNTLQRIDAMFSSGHPAWKTTQADVDAMGQQLDALRAQFNPLFAVEQRHQANLAEMQRAYKLGAIGADELAAAIDREKMAHASAIAALDGHTAATMRNNRANAQRTNLLFQLQDIGVSLVSGMNPLMVAAQQGSQISMIYGPGEGGLGRALQETGKMAAGMAARLWPVGLALAAGAAGIAGIRHEVEKTTGKAVSFGDVLLATFQVPANFIMSHLKPHIEAIQGWIEKAWDGILFVTKLAGNGMIARTLLIFETIKAAVGGLPDAFLVAGESAANFFLDSIEGMVRHAMLSLNSLFDGLNELLAKANIAPISLFDPSGLDFGRVDIGGDDATARLAAGWLEYEDTVKGIVSRDYIGEYIDALGEQAVANMNGRLEQTEQAATGAAGGMSRLKDEALGLSDAANAVTQELEFYKSTFTGFFTDIFKGLREGGNAWDVFASAAVTALDKIADRATAASADGSWGQIAGEIG